MEDDGEYKEGEEEWAGKPAHAELTSEYDLEESREWTVRMCGTVKALRSELLGMFGDQQKEPPALA